MKLVISAGHAKKVRGAAGPPPWGLDEVDEARKVTTKTAELLRSQGHDVTTYWDDQSTSQSENLDRIVNFHNAQPSHDYDISIHFNAYETTTTKKMGVECLWKTQEALSAKVSKAMADASDLPNRGAKYRSDLKFLNSTQAPAILVETLFCDAKPDCDAYRARFDAICAALASAISGQAIEAPPPERPPVRPPVDRPPVTVPPVSPPEAGGHPEIKKGDGGAAVVELQKALGVLIADGDFGSITEMWVKGFQAACGLKADGVVGPMTWEEVDDLVRREKMGGARLPPALVNQIVALAEASDIQEYLWPDRGISPPGLVPGIALCFAYSVREFQEGDDAATIMSKAQGSPDKDALAYYEAEFKKLGMSNKTAGLDTLRHLFVMMLGLSMRESSGRYVEGRDLTADNVQSETCEASLAQTSWNIKSFSASAIEPLLDDFWDNPNGFRDVFKLDVNPTADNLNCYGSGDGVRYQWLSRFAPLFHIMVSGVGLRTGRAHWGPVGRFEVTLKKEADVLFKQVQELVESVA